MKGGGPGCKRDRPAMRGRLRRNQEFPLASADKLPAKIPPSLRHSIVERTDRSRSNDWPISTWKRSSSFRRETGQASPLTGETRLSAAASQCERVSHFPSAGRRTRATHLCHRSESGDKPNADFPGPPEPKTRPQNRDSPPGI